MNSYDKILFKKYKNYLMFPTNFKDILISYNQNKIFEEKNKLEEPMYITLHEVADKILPKKDINLIEENKEIEIEIKNDYSNEEKKLGRKRANSNREGKHNKYSDDNLRKKCKHIILTCIKDFINNKLYEIYKENIGKGIFKKKLYMINNKQIINYLVEYNKDFLNKTLKDIFSENVSSRYSYISLDFNRELIKSLMNESDEEKKNYFNKLFNLTFLQCLNHFIKKEEIYELIGLETIDEVLDKYSKNDPEYKECLEYAMVNFEENIKKKRKRKKRKNKLY
jgi:hypothetical protein